MRPLTNRRLLRAVAGLAKIVPGVPALVRRYRGWRQIREERRLIEISGLFDAAFYLERYPDVADAGISPLRHYAAQGWRERRHPSADFDAIAYAETHGLPESVNPLVHHIRHGAAKNGARASTCQLFLIAVKDSGAFDTAFYLREYPDVAETSVDPIHHFLVDGWHEGRRPSPDFDAERYGREKNIGPEINAFLHYVLSGTAPDADCSCEQKEDMRALVDRRWYLDANPELVGLGCDPYLHYLHFGGQLGLDPNFFFDTSFYLDTYADVRESGLNPMLHYVRWGAVEGRDPGPHFSTGYYLGAYPDVRRAGMNPLAHFLLFGASEGRGLFSLFDPAWYLATYPDVRASGLPPLVHYLSRGAAEGRNPCRRFDTAWYLAHYSDVRRSGLNPLVHYLYWGAAEGRATCRSKSLRRALWRRSKAAIARWIPGLSLFHVRDHFMVLVPGQHLQGQEDNSFVTTGNDPQFGLSSSEGDLPRGGWAVVTLDIESASAPLRPVLYVQGGAAGNEMFAFELSAWRKRTELLLRLPPNIRAMRLDPTDIDNVRFAITALHIREIGKGIVLWRALRLQSFGTLLQILRSALAFDFGNVKARLRASLQADFRQIEYDAWVELYDSPSKQDIEAVRRAAAVLAQQPLLSVVMPVYNPRPEYLHKAIESVISQAYLNWELCIADDASTDTKISTVIESFRHRDDRIKVVYRKQNGHISAASNSALELVAGEFIVLMDHDDELPAHALYMVALELNNHPEADIIYTDEDKIDADGRRHDPYFKTDWNRNLFYSQNFIAHLGVYRTVLVRRAGGFREGFEGSQDYDLALRVLALTEDDRIRHIPHVLYHWRIFSGVQTFSTNNRSRSVSSAGNALADYFASLGETTQIIPIEPHQWWRIKWPLPSPAPHVTLIVPTRDRVELLRNCVDGLLNATDYPNLDVIIVDNGSNERETFAYFDSLADEPRLQVLRIDGPFNFSSLNNRAVEIARGELIGFINNDVEISDSVWLTEMASQVARPGIGAVGAKLYYGNDTIQHAGVTLGVYGVASHGHRHLSREAVGYFGRPMLVHEVSAVTAACMLVPKVVFESVGGFNETDLSVGYNDVDLCLKIREAGYRVLFTPYAELYHLESASRGTDWTSEKQQRHRRECMYMRSRWGELLDNDPAYSPNLALTDENFRIVFPPRVQKPWPIRRGDEGASVRLPPRREFDELYPQDAGRVRSVARDTAIVVAADRPFQLVWNLVASLASGGDCLPARLVVVDTSGSGEESAAAARQWQARLPATAIEVVRYESQDVFRPRACNLGFRAVRESNVLVISETNCVFSPGWFGYLVKAFCVHDGSAVVTPEFRLPGERVVVASSLLDNDHRNALAAGETYGFLPPVTTTSPQEAAALPVLNKTQVIGLGVFMGQRRVLADDGDGPFDQRYLIVGAEEDLSLRLQRNGVAIFATTASVVTVTAVQERNLTNLWLHQHDFSYLNRKWLLRQDGGDDLIEFVCPFHRGDVILGVQAAAQACRSGKRVRFHVAEALLPWVVDFQPPFAVEPLPVPVPKGRDTPRTVLSACSHVIQRHDAAPTIARSHPRRGLSETGGNLVGFMLEELGIAGTPIVNLWPQADPLFEAEGRRLIASFGGNVVLLHPSGGWDLKTIPEAMVDMLADVVRKHGLALVQIGGKSDSRRSACDGWITENFTPSQWMPIFRAAKGVIGVDSWSAHFAAILDVPQITLYGSTNPRHVNSKGYFGTQEQPSLVLGPALDCSPCNALVCRRTQGVSCEAYTLDVPAVAAFLDRICA